jgi:hypothetical protein
MPAFLVRVIKSRDLVGIFMAGDEIGLAIAVDECIDVPGCEYTQLPDGGIMWESPTKPVPLDAGDPDDDNSPVEAFPWTGASLTERWWNIAYGFEEVEWEPFDGEVPEPELPQPVGPGRVIPMRKRQRDS